MHPVLVRVLPTKKPSTHGVPQLVPVPAPILWELSNTASALNIAAHVTEGVSRQETISGAPMKSRHIVTHSSSESPAAILKSQRSARFMDAPSRRPCHARFTPAFYRRRAVALHLFRDTMLPHASAGIGHNAFVRRCRSAATLPQIAKTLTTPD